MPGNSTGTLLPYLFIGALVIGTLALGAWAVRDLYQTWTGQHPGCRGGSGGGMIGAMVEIDHLVRPNVTHVERVDEEAESEQENDGE